MPAPTKVLFLITSLDVGGAEKQLARVVSRLDREQFTPVVVSLLPPGPVAAEIERAGIAVHSLGMRRGVASTPAAIRCLRLLRRERPGLLVSFMFHANLLGRIAGRAAGVPKIVSSIRNSNFGGARRDRMIRLTDRLCRITVTNCQAAAQRIVRDGVVPPRKLTVIPNGIDLADYEMPANTRDVVRHEIGLSGNPFTWIAIGRIEAQKNYPLLLDGFSIAARSDPNSVLFIVGDGPQRRLCEEFARQLNIAERVFFLGIRQDIPRLLAAADAIVLSSAWEGLPNVLLEAGAASLPCVATDVGGVSEAVVDGETGLLSPPADQDALAGAMRRLMQCSPEERRAMGRRAHEHVRSHYAIDRIVTQWEELFARLIFEKEEKKMKS